MGVLQQRLPLPDSLPRSLASLIERCWGPVPATRPSFEQVLAELRHMAVYV